MANPDSFDYIIIGGGTSGLVLASRLTEDPSVHVLVLEAGKSHIDDPRVNMPAGWPALLGSDADWSFKTTPQKGLQSRLLSLPQGRVLGGSSAINSNVFMMPSKAGFDAWAELGNRNWDWSAMRPYFNKFHTLNLPTQSDADALHLTGLYAPGHQTSGTIQASWPDIQGNPFPKAWLQTFQNLGWSFKGDLTAGETIGAYSNPATIHPTTRTRSYSVAYFEPIKERPNLHLLTDAYVQKIILEGQSEPYIASGIEYLSADEPKVRSVRATREVILAAGTYQSPKILELSGIGSPNILDRAGITIKIPNERVGENLQDHLCAGISYEVMDNMLTMDDLGRQRPEALQAAMEQYVGEQRGPFSQAAFNSTAFLPIPESGGEFGRGTMQTTLSQHGAEAGDPPHYGFVRSIIEGSTESSGMYFMYAAQGNWGCSNAHELPIPVQPGNYLTAAVILLNPLSTGSTHISSAKPTDPPLINPNYLDHPLDAQVLARHVHYIDSAITKTEPLASLLKPDGRRNVVYKPFSTLTDVEDYVRTVAMSNWHPVGTCSMMPRNKGGVVDEDLLLYGTKNLRVVDASIMPIITRSNTVATVYAIAERAADIIKSHRA